jgi:hypothetical protein
MFHTKLCIPQVPYAAISYTWTSRSDGDDHSNGDLYELVDVDGHETSLCHNLAMALRSVRLEVSQCLWVYALRIDQSNTAERNIQVVRMRNILSNATNVLAWLGPAAKGSDLAMDFLAHLTRHSCKEHIGAWLGNEGVHPSTHVLQALNEPGAACAG